MKKVSNYTCKIIQLRLKNVNAALSLLEELHKESEADKNADCYSLWLALQKYAKLNYMLAISYYTFGEEAKDCKGLSDELSHASEKLHSLQVFNFEHSIENFHYQELFDYIFCQPIANLKTQIFEENEAVYKILVDKIKNGK